MNAPLAIDIVSDVVCPWCYIGTAHLEAALRARPGLAVTVRYLPFLLDPSTPDAGADLRARLKAKYGRDPEAMFGRVEAAGRAAGLALDFSRVRRASATVRAHTLLRHADARGTQRALAHALFAAYFTEGRDVGDLDVLVPLAVSHGFTEAEARALLDDAAELQRTRDEAEALRRGASAHPRRGRGPAPRGHHGGALLHPRRPLRPLRGAARGGDARRPRPLRRRAARGVAIDGPPA